MSKYDIRYQITREELDEGIRVLGFKPTPETRKNFWDWIESNAVAIIEGYLFYPELNCPLLDLEEE